MATDAANVGTEEAETRDASVRVQVSELRYEL